MMVLEEISDIAQMATVVKLIFIQPIFCSFEKKESRFQSKLARVVTQSFL